MGRVLARLQGPSSLCCGSCSSRYTNPKMVKKLFSPSYRKKWKKKKAWRGDSGWDDRSEEVLGSVSRMASSVPKPMRGPSATSHCILLQNILEKQALLHSRPPSSGEKTKGKQGAGSQKVLEQNLAQSCPHALAWPLMLLSLCSGLTAHLLKNLRNCPPCKEHRLNLCST